MAKKTVVQEEEIYIPLNFMTSKNTMTLADGKRLLCVKL